MSASKFSVEITKIPGVLVLEPATYTDERGFFLESYNERDMAEIGIRDRFVQDNHSYSVCNVLRGLHYQLENPQGKLVRVIDGAIIDVAVDLRRSSPSFGKWHTEILTGENRKLLWIPIGMAHGFRVLSESAHVLYKATNFYEAKSERTIAWNDKRLNIDWEVNTPPIISPKDSRGISFQNAPIFE